MSLLNAVFIYLLLWWLTLFTILPIGVERHAETGKGHDAGAPINPMLIKKFILTTAVSGVELAVIWLLVHMGIIRWDDWFRNAIQ